MGQRLAGLPHPAGLPAVDATHSTASLVAAAYGSQLPVAALPGKAAGEPAPRMASARVVTAKALGNRITSPVFLQVIVFNRVRRVS